MIARGLPDLAVNCTVRLWACSAGYGLIPTDALVHPYAATFTSGHQDSVAASAEEARAWWDALGRWEGPCPDRPHSILALAEVEPKARFLLALSAPYLRACVDDILDASKVIEDPDHLMVVSAGSRNPGSVATWVLPADARLQTFVGGTRQAINARIVAHLLRSGITSRAWASQYLGQLLAEQPPIPRFERKPMSDEEILARIEERLARSPGASASKLLREFRDSGNACEQGRFGRLYRQHAENMK